MLVAEYKKSILLIEDHPKRANTLQRWLVKEDYAVQVADSLSTAEKALDEHHFHLALVDIRLNEEDVDNQDGMLFIDRVEERGLGDALRCIILTGHGTKETAISVVSKPHVVDYVEKEGGYRQTLLEAIRKYFDETSPINFDLRLDGDSDNVLNDVVRDVWWSGRPIPAPVRLIPETLDLFGHLYSQAIRIYISRLRPGLSGASTVHTHPTWEKGLGPSYVTKISRRDKIEIEQKNFDNNVNPYLSANIITRVNAAYTQSLGAIQYTFAEDGGDPLCEFDEIYHKRDTEQVVKCLKRVIFETCVNWYAEPKLIVDNIPDLYYQAFNLRETRLHAAFEKLLDHFDPDEETIWLPRYEREVVNPVWWLKRNRNRCVLRVYQCITHGDLTGRNIMTRQDGSKCWLIDFYRTHESHLLRDFVILETDIKYRLLGDIGADGFARVESALFDGTRESDELAEAGESLPTETKAIQTVRALRNCAAEVSHPLRAKDRDSAQREYLLSLLMATLNVTRLRHITKERKLDALWSSAHICDRLDATGVAVA